MIKTLRESKATLSALVEMAAQGEEIIITVRGKPKARLGPVAAERPAPVAAWSKRLREARAKYSVGPRDTGGAILDDLRSDRS